MTKFKPGDRVVVIPHFEQNDEIPVGATGTILDTSLVPYVKMDDNSYNLLNSFLTDDKIRIEEKCTVLYEEELEPIEEPTKFKTGDRVILTNSKDPNLIPNGQRGTVLNKSIRPYVEMDDNDYNCFVSVSNCNKVIHENCTDLYQEELSLIK